MSNLVSILIGAAWLAIFGMLVWGIATGWRRQLRNDTPLPLFRLLERQGLSLSRVEEAVGIEELARAAGRCANCAMRPACEAGVFGKRPLGCPNGSLFDRLTGHRLVETAS